MNKITVHVSDGWAFVNRRWPVPNIVCEFLPLAIQRALRTDGHYEIRRVRTGGIPVRIAIRQNFNPGSYLDSAGAICGDLLRAFGIDTVKERRLTVRVKITKAKRQKGKA